MILPKALLGNIWFRWSLVLLWMWVIFAFSNQPHSGELSERYLHGWNILVRKAAHMTEYGVLFWLVRWALWGSWKGEQERPIAQEARDELTEQPTKEPASRVVAAVACTICLTYAGSDEWHQSFVPGRSAQLSDVMVDMCGVAVALVLCHLPGLKSFWSNMRN